jgi:ATP-binding cassette, subfamily B, bacterial
MILRSVIIAHKSLINRVKLQVKIPSRIEAAWQRIHKQLPFIPWILRLIWQAAPGLALAWIVLLVLNSLIPLALVLVTRELVNRLAEFATLNTDQIIGAALLGLVAVALLLVNTASLLIIAYVRIAQAEYISDFINHRIHQKVISLDLSYFDSQNYYDDLYRTYADALDKPAQFLGSMGDLATVCITFAGLFIILASYSLWIPLVLILGALPILIVLLRHTLIFKRWRDENVDKERRSNYLNWLLVERESAPELRLFLLGDFYSSAYDQLRQGLRSDYLSLERRKLVTQILSLLGGSIAIAFIVGWMGWQVYRGAYQLGDLAVFLQIFLQGQALVRQLVANVTDVYRNILFVENLYTLLQSQSRLKESAAAAPIQTPLREGIRFENISFRYPDSERSVLENFNWHVPANQTVALIGENGEGKSTLLKLLCRFYDPDAGRILWDGVDIRDMPLDFIRQSVSVLFQEPLHYVETVFDNIALSDRASQPTLQRVQAASQSAGAHTFVTELPQQYQTLLGRWFGGEELSVGQWQRLALARAFLRDSPILALDEPTSAMDAWAEMDWLTKFGTVAHRRTAIMITHRFTTAMRADRIDLMVDGHIVESGTHEELLAANGRYAQSWREQARDIERKQVGKM